MSLKYASELIKMGLRKASSSEDATELIGRSLSAAAHKPVRIMIELGGQQGHYIIDNGYRAYSVSDLPVVIVKAIKARIMRSMAGMFGPELTGIELDAPDAKVMKDLDYQLSLWRKAFLTFDPNTDRYLVSKVATSGDEPSAQRTIDEENAKISSVSTAAEKVLKCNRCGKVLSPIKGYEKSVWRHCPCGGVATLKEASVSRGRRGMDFSTKKQMDDYLRDHPDADKSKHRVVEHDPKDMDTHPFNLMRKRQNEEKMKQIGKHYKKDPKDLTVDEIEKFNQRGRKATGEMSMRDIQPGGEYHDWAHRIEQAARTIQQITARGGYRVSFLGMKPFDVYQGPYAVMTEGKLWSSGEDDENFYFEFRLHDGILGDPNDIAIDILERKGYGPKFKKAADWSGGLPITCDFCKKPVTDKWFVDGNTNWGSWANMCPRCYLMNGVGTGPGRGQKYDAKTGKKISGSDNGLRSRRAMYWCAPDRTYRLTQQEQASGLATCPKCKVEMSKERFTRSDKLLNCPECGFKVPTSKAVTKVEVKVPEGVSVQVTQQDDQGNDVSGQNVMADSNLRRGRSAAVSPEELADLSKLSLSSLAMLVYKDWKSVNYAAKPYLEAMASLDNVSDMYGQDTGTSIVAYFLGNANSWRGDVAKAVKKELQRRIRR